jgi:lipoprotein-releasing system ATP-binding protein
MSKPHLVLTDVHRHYGQGDKIVRVLEAANLTVNSGELVALVAPSGAGKSTLLHLSGLLESPQSGEVEIIGIKTSKLGDRGRTQLRRSTVGYVYQFHHLLPEFTALENAEMPLRIARLPAADRARAATLLQRVGLGERLEHRPGMLSGGEQQRVAIARALVMDPALLLADEPTGDLDEHTADSLHALLREMHRERGLTSVIATHNPRLAAACDRVLRLEDGRLKAA